MTILSRYETTAGAREDILDKQDHVQNGETVRAEFPILRDGIALKKLYNESSSMKEVSLKIGCGETAVHKWIHRHGITPKPRLMCQKGVRKSITHRKKMSESAKRRTGELNSNWKGGVMKLNALVRSHGYTLRRKSVLERDNYECQHCGIDIDLHVHHILQIRDYPDLANDISNCMTLCGKCHRAIHFPNKNQANSVKPYMGNAELNLQGLK